MNGNRNLGLYAVAVAIGVVGALWAGVPVGTLAVFALVLACPLMMMFMMGGMHGGMHGGSDQDRSDSHDQCEHRDHDSHQHH